jgi:hypothetical protein
MAATLPRPVPRLTPGTNGAPAGPVRSMVALRYSGKDKITLRGPISGRVYRFSGLEPALPVDAGDAAALLRSHLFRPA